MADISKEIADFKSAVHGEEVRGSMISLAEKLNTEVEENTTNVNQAVETANAASTAANQAVQDAAATLQAANQAVTSAAGSASAAAGSASAAAGSAEYAAGSATSAAGSASAAAQSAADAAEAAAGLGGFNGSASSVTAIDIQGLLGGPGASSNVQALIDYIADQVKNQLITDSALTAKLANYILKSQIVNNLLATQAGNVLDAVQGKALDDKITQLNSDLQFTTQELEVNSYGTGRITLQKIGRIVILIFSGVQITNKNGSYTYIATSPYKPAIGSAYQDACDIDGTSFRIVVNANGEIGINYGATSPSYYGNFVYISAE